MINLTHTIAVTQNFCSYTNFDRVWLSTRSGRKKMASKWLARLQQLHPTLAAAAEELNRRDSFVMAAADKSATDHPTNEPSEHKKKKKKLKERSDKDPSHTDSEQGFLDINLSALFAA